MVGNKNSFMTFIRSLLFYILFYLSTIMIMLCFLPTLLLPPKYSILPPKIWSHITLFLICYVCGLRCEIRGQEHLQAAKQDNGAILIACQHQSAWETLVLFAIFERPLFVLKKELLSIPIIGWYFKKVGCIAVNRKGSGNVIKQLVNQAQDRLNKGRQLIIFPEGTRNSSAKPMKLKAGIERIQTATNIPVLPATLNSGKFWQRNGFYKHKGTVILQFYPPIEQDIREQLTTLFYE